MSLQYRIVILNSKTGFYYMAQKLTHFSEKPSEARMFSEPTPVIECLHYFINREADVFVEGVRKGKAVITWSIQDFMKQHEIRKNEQTFDSFLDEIKDTK